MTLIPEVLPDADAVARHAARLIAQTCRDAVAARGRCVLALSGGRTPWLMLRAFAGEDVPWAHLHIAQVDERVAPDGDPDRNLTSLAAILANTPLRPDQLHAMPVAAPDLKAACRAFAATLRDIAGAPPIFDLVHLGLGADGHTASLLPGDAALAVTDADVALTGTYQGHRRMTLTYPALDRARCVLWLVTGADKQAACARLCAGDRSIPAGRVRQDHAHVLADQPAAALVG